MNRDEFKDKLADLLAEMKPPTVSERVEADKRTQYGYHVAAVINKGIHDGLDGCTQHEILIATGEIIRYCEEIRRSID